MRQEERQNSYEHSGLIAVLCFVSMFLLLNGCEQDKIPVQMFIAYAVPLFITFVVNVWRFIYEHLN